MEQQIQSEIEVKNLSTEAPTQKQLSFYGRGVRITDQNLINQLDSYSMEDVVELKISRFLDQLGNLKPENMHSLILSKVEKPLITQILRRVGGNQVKASKVLGINRNTLRKKMKQHGLT